MHKKRATFPIHPFNGQKSINLPSNLLQGRTTSFNIDRKPFYDQATITKMGKTFLSYKNPQQILQRYKNDRLTKQIQQRSLTKKQVLYKRLSNIRVDHKQLVGLSFSKLLSKMVVMDENKDDEDSHQNLFSPSKNKKYLQDLKCIKQTQYKMESNYEPRNISKSIDVCDVQVSKKIFKKYYMPHSQVRNPNFLNTISNQQKYIYKNGKRVQCKRIHNFYTSHMYKRGYDKFFRNTLDSFTQQPQ